MIKITQTLKARIIRNLIIRNLPLLDNYLIHRIFLFQHFQSFHDLVALILKLLRTSFGLLLLLIFYYDTSVLVEVTRYNKMTIQNVDFSLQNATKHVLVIIMNLNFGVDFSPPLDKIIDLI